MVGRVLLRGLINPKISKASGVVLDSRISTVLIKPFVNKNNIDMTEYEVPRHGYPSFNEFFYRKRKQEYLINNDGTTLICPCDGLLTIKDIDEDTILRIKHSEYSVKELLHSNKGGERYAGGQALIFRLTPGHYHRYDYCTNGVVTRVKRIPGVLHCVRPIAVGRIPVFTQNTREYQIIKNDVLGKVTQMEVGAMLVGKISNLKKQAGIEVTSGEEKGYFEYGGSTIIVLLPNKLKLNEEIINRAKIDGEIPVKIGEILVD